MQHCMHSLMSVRALPLSCILRMYAEMSHRSVSLRACYDQALTNMPECSRA